jgi:ribosomal protein S18 acetylase RimI-like enzyme
LELNALARGLRRRFQRKPAVAKAASRVAADRARGVAVRPVRIEDLSAVIDLDQRNTGVAKPEYWRDLYERYAQRARARFFLVAEQGTGIAGFIIGEVRAWEFGSEPCGWVFAIQVKPEARMHHIGTQLLEAIDDCFRRDGVSKVRTMLRRNEHVIMAFFRSQGMMAGPFIQLEKDLDDATAVESGKRRT